MSEKRIYETIFLVTPDVSEDEYKQIVEKFKSFISKNDAEITHEELWGVKKLAYPIQKKTNAYYVLLEFETSNGELIGNLETEYGYNENVIRYLTVKLDKYGVEYNKKRKAQRAK